MKLTFVLSLLVISVMGQNIKGTVVDYESKKRLANVHVFVNVEKTGTISNKKGIFTLKTKSFIKRSDIIIFSHVGYKTVKHTFKQLKEMNFHVTLTKKTENLDEIIIASERNLKPKINYTQLSSLKKGVYNFGSTLINNKIYVIGGDKSYLENSAMRALTTIAEIPQASFRDFLREKRSNFSYVDYNDQIQIYDIEKDIWTISESKFRKRANHKVISLNNQIYVLGGKRLSKKKTHEYLDDKIEVLNMSTQEIIIDNTNPHQAINFAAFTYQDNIIVMGGSIKKNKNGKKIYTDKSFFYNVTSGYWYQLPKMKSPKEANGILINNKIYLFGGHDGNSLKNIESYDIVSGKWKNEGSMFNEIEKPALTSYNNDIYIFDNGKILTYNIKTKILKEFKIDLDIKNSQIYLHQNKLYIVGGSIDDNHSRTASNGLFSVDITEFSNTRIRNSKNLKNNI